MSTAPENGYKCYYGQQKMIYMHLMGKAIT